MGHMNDERTQNPATTTRGLSTLKTEPLKTRKPWGRWASRLEDPPPLDEDAAQRRFPRTEDSLTGWKILQFP
jgi:hypothetical protein